MYRNIDMEWSWLINTTAELANCRDRQIIIIIIIIIMTIITQRQIHAQDSCSKTRSSNIQCYLRIRAQFLQLAAITWTGIEGDLYKLYIVRQSSSYITSPNCRSISGRHNRFSNENVVDGQYAICANSEWYFSSAGKIKYHQVIKISNETLFFDWR